MMVGLQLLATREGAGRSVQFDVLEAVDTQLREHEFGPVLAQVAEEHQPEALAHRVDGQPIVMIPERRQPLGQRAGFGRRRLQPRQPDTLARAPADAERQQAVAHVGADLRSGRQRKQRFQRQRLIFLDPAALDQRLGSFDAIADLGVDQATGSEIDALAHDHPHQQRLGRLRRALEAGNESDFFGTQQIRVARRQPVEHSAEVGKVIERVFERRQRHGVPSVGLKNTG